MSQEFFVAAGYVLILHVASWKPFNNKCALIHVNIATKA